VNRRAADESGTAEGLDIERPGALEAYLRATGRVGREEPLDVRPLSGGVSNRTLLVRRAGGESWVVKQALPKLRVAVDWFSDPARIQREAAGMRWLYELAPPGAVPRLIFEDRDCHLLAMEAVPEPHENWKNTLLAGRLELDHVRQFAELLGTVHRRAHQRRQEIAASFAERTFFESLRLEPYYGYTATQVPAAARFLRALVDRTRQTHETLVHGDYSPKNILVRGPQLVLLDHEVVHWGDPAFDLGFSLTHLLSKAHFLVAHRGAFAQAAHEYAATYLRALGTVPWRESLPGRAVEHTLGCLLGRVAGRSPLEYLDSAHHDRQREAVLSLIEAPPATTDDLVDAFLGRV
jgi:aminoglycoside phosphotransferase (APT) family kinase protein